MAWRSAFLGDVVGGAFAIEWGTPPDIERAWALHRKYRTLHASLEACVVALAVDIDPLSLLLRLCAAVPAPCFHTVRYAGVLDEPEKGCRYWPWAELMVRSFELDVKKCPSSGGAGESRGPGM